MQSYTGSVTGKAKRTGRKRSVWIVCLTVLLLGVFSFAGCVTRVETGEKLQDLEFTVLDKEDVPEEFKSRLEEAKSEPFQMSYADQGSLYIARGYGKQPTSGYSVTVTGLYETENSICISTDLLARRRGKRRKRPPHTPMWWCGLIMLKKILFLIEEERDGAYQESGSLYTGRKKYF